MVSVMYYHSHRANGTVHLSSCQFQQNMTSIRNVAEKMDDTLRSLSELWTWLNRKRSRYTCLTDT